MFNPHHHQQQQQFQQHLRHLQQLFQQQTPQPPPPPPPPPQPPPAHHMPHHHGGARPMAAPAPPPARMVNLCSATQTIIAPNPMLQGALLMQQMQGNMRSFAMGGQQFQQFFATGTRSSILGPVPLGVAIKTPHMGFPPRHFNPHARYYNSNDFQARPPDRKRENEQRPALCADSQSAAGSSRDEAAAVADVSSQSSTQQPDEPTSKKQRTEGEDTLETESSSNAQFEHPPEDPDTAELIPVEDGTVSGTEAAEAQEQSRASEQVEISESESSPKDTEQPNSQSEHAELVTDDKGDANGNNEGKRDEAGDTPNKFFCYICSITCHNQQNFQSHMNGLAHQQRMMEIQHMSNACLVTLLPRVQESLQGTRKDIEKRPGLQRWCAACKTHFTSNVMEHRKTKEHKVCSRSTSPSCTVCKQQFRTSREFVEHMQSSEHKQHMEQLLKDAGTGKLGDLDLHVCAVGADDECMDSEEEETLDEENGQDGLPVQMEVTLEDITEEEEFDQDTVYGSSFVMPVAGFLCRLCNEFYHYEKSARYSHCKTRQHFENLKKYKALKVEEALALPSSSEYLCSSGDPHTEDTESPSSFSLSDTAVNNSEQVPAETAAAANQESTTTPTSSTSNGSTPPPSTNQPSPPPPKVKDTEEDLLLEETENEEDTGSSVLEEKTGRGRGRVTAKKRGRGGRRR